MRRAHRKVLSVVGAAALVLGGIVVLSAAPAAGVTQVTVTNNSNSGPGSLRQAILDANAGGPNQADDAQITIPASVGNISLSSQLTYDGGSGSAHNIEIIGNGQTITQTAAGNAILLLLTNGATTVTGLTLTGVSNSSAVLGL